MDNTLQNDPAFEKVREMTVKDAEISKEFVDKALDLLKEQFDNKEEFTIKHGFLGLSKLIIALTQSLCENEEQYHYEMIKAQDIVTNKVMPSILPKIEDGEVVKNNYDMEDLSIRRIMMTTGTIIDYVLWRNDMSSYSAVRAEMEEEELKSETEVETAKE